ncbi:hypothetical protein [Kutzneria sp. NPDC052558]|uniref:hypothetical protein n=1 Tax=Kutzneria sp. NPDC052558 TaxID=3364121 RepID=UPI0037CC2296
MLMLNELLADFLAARGLHWEIHVDNTPTDFWTYDGDHAHAWLRDQVRDGRRAALDS